MERFDDLEHSNSSRDTAANVLDAAAITGTLDISELQPVCDTDVLIHGNADGLASMQANENHQSSAAYLAHSGIHGTWSAIDESLLLFPSHYQRYSANEAGPTAGQSHSLTRNRLSHPGVQQDRNPYSGDRGSPDVWANGYRPVIYPIYQQAVQPFEELGGSMHPPPSPSGYSYSTSATSLGSTPGQQIPYFGNPNGRITAEYPAIPSYMEIGNMIRQREIPFPGDAVYYPQSGGVYGMAGPGVPTRQQPHSPPARTYSPNLIHHTATPSLPQRDTPVLANNQHHGLQDSWSYGSAPHDPGFLDLDNHIPGPIACESGVAAVQASEVASEGTQKAAPKRKRASQPRARAATQAVSCASGGSGNVAEKLHPKKRLRRAVSGHSAQRCLQNVLDFSCVGQPAASSADTGSLQSASCAVTSSSASPSFSSSNTTGAAGAISGPLWHSAAPADDLSPAPVLTGPDDPDSDVLPAADQGNLPSQGKTLKLCLLPWEYGTVLWWQDIPREQQLRAVRRLRLAYPGTSWSRAEAHISKCCRKQKSEKERQEDRRIERKAARDARQAVRASGPRSVEHDRIAVRSASPFADGILSAPAGPLAPLDTATASPIGPMSLLGRESQDLFSAQAPDPNAFDCFVQASSPSEDSGSDAISQASALAMSDTELGPSHVNGDSEIAPESFSTASTAGSEGPLFLPSDEEADDMDEFWSELFRTGEFPNNLREWRAEDLLFRTPTLQDPIVSRVEEMNARDMQAAENLGFSLADLGVASARQLVGMSPDAVPFFVAGADSLDEHCAVEDAEEASRASG
ncbi:hypothetical protein BZA77DRAFT_365900 [Pyronema omphalodes]|nr:hypothetical protein BZA77DRAFT_365900 [Pyronema omphalodes]